ncbi:MAG: excinuclease ABC subunit UvrA, partial [Bdellovibrionales bacterium]|nr:excinuclease ABC subunit UvrA [Bdellovibrionales bacterium]
RLKPEAEQVLINEKSIVHLGAMTIDHLIGFFDDLHLTDHELEIAHEIYTQIKSRLSFLRAVGVDYLTLDRPSKTLSGGEFQRLNLANQLGMGLSQTLYVLDEPTVGLHPRDNDRLISVLKELRNLGNTLVVVEHDRDVIENSTHIIEIGPGSGHLGGEVIYAGTSEDFFSSADTLTAKYLKPKKMVFLETPKRPVDISTYKYTLDIMGCTGNNLKKIDAKIPLNRIVTITGVSGSGKSTLVSGTLYPALARELRKDFIQGHEFKSLTGVQHVKNLLYIDQTPVGKTERSNPVTYLKVYDAIRNIFASQPEAKAMGFTAGTFSLNVDGGRCPTCKGLGYEVIDMMFMDDIEIPCDTCDGKKFRPEVLDVRYKRKNIADILNLTVAEAMDFFISYPNIRRPLSLLKEVGMDYIRLGQSSRSLSGGESQRLKIAREFNSSNHKNTLFILDEPTTGLHFQEVDLLLKTLNRLVDSGGSVLLVEHNLEVIAQSDYIIDIGPEAGSKGGQIIAQGSPADIIQSKKSLTGKYLKEYLENTHQIQFDFPTQNKKKKKKKNSQEKPL